MAIGTTLDDATHAQAAGPGVRAVQIWLACVALLVFAMIVVGGATRLTDSGLSITEWKPILGAIPPLTEAHWLEALEKYRQIPEYQIVNKGMSLEAFQFIYWWEWSHRFLGRFIGLAFALPLAWFWLRGHLAQPGLKPRLIAILALGGVQGVIGWYMVMSGLVDRIDVSQYRLALHLNVAFLILAAIVWVGLSLSPGARSGDERIGPGLRWAGVVLLVMLLAQGVLGAFVAGMKAGLAYNTWPLMNGELVPDGLMVMSPWYLNLFENALTVQFNHRLMAYALLAMAAWHAWSLAQSAPGSPAAGTALMLLAALIVQALFGI